MRTVLVTGGAGFIGSHLVEQLLGSGAAVRILDNLSSGSLHNVQGAARRQRARNGTVRGSANGSRLELIIGDIRDAELVRKATRSVTTVFHMAALPSTALSLVSPSELDAINVQGTLNVLQAAISQGVPRLVFGSCASVYGRPESLPVSEACPLKPESLFAASKLAAETYCRTYSAVHKLDVVMLRYFSVYGPRQSNATDGALIPTLIEALRRRQPAVPYDGATAEDLTYVDDAVEATLAAADTPKAPGHAINIGSGQMSSVDEILQILYHLLRVPPVCGLKLGHGARSHRIQAGITLAADLLGCTPRVSVVAGLTRLVRSMTDPEPFDSQTFVEVSADEKRPDV